MSKHNRQRPRARSRAFRSPKRRLLVLCEGRLTEPQYLTGLKISERKPSVEIEIPDVQGTPLTLVKEGVDRKRQSEKESKRQKDEFLKYDEVWCVFDKDEHPYVPDALQLARSNGIKIALSNPCFELWLLLHFRDQPGARHRHDVQQLVGQHVSGYEKKIDFTNFVDGIDDATRRAARLDSDAEEEGELCRNPTTGVYKLILSIRS